MPATPSSALTTPSCIAPLPDSAGSSSCSARTPPHRRWYCSARRNTPASVTGRPSSVKPAAPSARSSAMSVSSVPCRPRVIAGMKPTGTRASRAAASSSAPRIGALSIDRRRVRHRDDGAVAARGGRARAGLEVLLVLLAGRAQVHVRIDERREQVASVALDDLAAVGRGAALPAAAISAISPPRTRTSRRPSRPVRGSSAWTSRSSRSAGRAGALTRRTPAAPCWGLARGCSCQLGLGRARGAGAGRARRPGPRRAPPCGRPPPP